jgi:hypothetical protein
MMSQSPHKILSRPSRKSSIIPHDACDASVFTGAAEVVVVRRERERRMVVRVAGRCILMVVVWCGDLRGC